MTSGRELMARRFRPDTADTTCLLHATRRLDDRPLGCLACRHDLEVAYQQTIGQIEWLNGWRDDALNVLARQDDALHLLDGYELWEHQHRPGASVARENPDGEREPLLDDVSVAQAAALVALLRRVVEAADGIVPLIP